MSLCKRLELRVLVWAPFPWRRVFGTRKPVKMRSSDGASVDFPSCGSLRFVSSTASLVGSGDAGMIAKPKNNPARGECRGRDEECNQAADGSAATAATPITLMAGSLARGAASALVKVRG